MYHESLLSRSVYQPQLHRNWCCSRSNGHKQQSLKNSVISWQVKCEMKRKKNLFRSWCHFNSPKSCFQNSKYGTYALNLIRFQIIGLVSTETPHFKNDFFYILNFLKDLCRDLQPLLIGWRLKDKKNSHFLLSKIQILSCFSLVL